MSVSRHGFDSASFRRLFASADVTFRGHRIIGGRPPGPAHSGLIGDTRGGSGAQEHQGITRRPR